jgi:hypothetical protein
MFNKRIQKEGKHGKFESLWLGPYKIDDVAGNNSFYLSHIDGERLPLSVNGKVLKMFYENNI